MKTDTASLISSQSPARKKAHKAQSVQSSQSALCDTNATKSIVYACQKVHVGGLSDGWQRTLRTPFKITCRASGQGPGSSVVGVGSGTPFQLGLPSPKECLESFSLPWASDGKPLTFNELRLMSKVAAVSFEASLLQVVNVQWYAPNVVTDLGFAGAPGAGRRCADKASSAPGAPSLSISNISIEASTNLLQGGHKRCAEVIAQELLKLAKVYGIERLAFLTLTFAEEPESAKEALRRFNSLRTNWLKKRYVKGVRVLERGDKNDRLHFHCVVVVDRDIRTGVDFDAIERGDYRSANEYLRAEWALLRETMPKYGFGRPEMLPVKSTAEGIARYVGSYVGKHIRSRHDDDKGARLVGFWGYGAGERASTCQFAFRTENSCIWRFKVATWAASVGAKTTDDLNVLFGPKWCVLFYDDIMLQQIDGNGDAPVYPYSLSPDAIEKDLAIREEIYQRRQAAFEEKQWLQHYKWDRQRARALEPIKREARKICAQVADEQFLPKNDQILPNQEQIGPTLVNAV